MASQEIISIYLQAEGGELVVAKLKEVENQIAKLNTSFKKGSLGTIEYANQFKKLNSRMQYLVQPAKDIVDAQKAIEKQTFNTQRRIKSLQGAMLNLGLSTMFMGMQIQRTFGQIAKTSIDSFMKISAGQTPAGQAITALGGAFEYLKYSVGDAIATALMPFLPMLLDIIDSLGDWIDQNPELTAGLLGIGLALGGIMFYGGQLLTFFNGLIGAAPEIGSAIKGLGLVFSNLGKIVGLSGLMGSIAGLGLALLGLVAIAIIVDQFFKFLTNNSKYLSDAFDILTGNYKKGTASMTQSTLDSTRKMGRFWVWLGTVLDTGFTAGFMSLITILVLFKTVITSILYAVGLVVLSFVKQFLEAVLKIANAYNQLANFFNLPRMDTSDMVNSINSLGSDIAQGAGYIDEEMTGLVQQITNQGLAIRDSLQRARDAMDNFDIETAELKNQEKINTLLKERARILSMIESGSNAFVPGFNGEFLTLFQRLEELDTAITNFQTTATLATPSVPGTQQISGTPNQQMTNYITINANGDYEFDTAKAKDFARNISDELEIRTYGVTANGS